MNSTTAAAAPTATTAQGNLKGAWEDGVAVFRAVPYAAPPVGRLRFAPPQPPAAWAGVRDAGKNGPCPPQFPSRLERIMGAVSYTQDEDSLTLNVYTPAADGKTRPVMVYFHGGAWMTGSGSWPIYNGAPMAKEGDTVIVAINYRLGVLGYLYVPELEGSGGGNFGLLDHVQALRWVQENIKAFGGDPANVTVFGQSAGGGSIAALMELPEAASLFRRAILQSAATMPHTTVDEANAITDAFLKNAGLDRANIAKLRDLPVAKILELQRATMMQIAKPGNPTPPFRMVKDGKVVRHDPPAGIRTGMAKGIDVMIGTVADEMHAFFAAAEPFDKLDRAGAIGMIKGAVGPAGPDAEKLYDGYAAQMKGATPLEIMCQAQTDAMFRLSSLRFAEAQAAQGAPVYVYRFDWEPVANATFGAAHCIELPFMFGNIADWDKLDPLMLKGGDRAEMGTLAKAMQGAWLAFARTGNPNHPGLPEWKTFDAKGRASFVFDKAPRAAADLDGSTEALWKKAGA